MTSFRLKIIAYFTMFIDHIGHLFFPTVHIMTIVGRISFPLFAFLIAEGLRHTKNTQHYFLRLFIFACISQIPFYYFVTYTGDKPPLNILFSLAISLLFLIFLTRKQYALLLATALTILYIEYVTHMEYGWYGVLTVCAMYFIAEGKKVIGSMLFIILTLIQSIMYSPFDIKLQIFAVFGLIPILLYNGTRGYKISRWWFYAIYPVHLIILILVYKLLG